MYTVWNTLEKITLVTNDVHVQYKYEIPYSQCKFSSFALYFSWLGKFKSIYLNLLYRQRCLIRNEEMSFHIFFMLVE